MLKLDLCNEQEITLCFWIVMGGSNHVPMREMR